MSNIVDKMSIEEVIADLNTRGYIITTNEDGTFCTRIKGMNGVFPSTSEEENRRLLSKTIKDEEQIKAARARGESCIVLSSGILD